MRLSCAALGVLGFLFLQVLPFEGEPVHGNSAPDGESSGGDHHEHQFKGFHGFGFLPRGSFGSYRLARLRQF
jgi:hypothetical protein